MNNKSLEHVILCGGVGSRLWPLSRPNYPKQFLKIFEGQSLFQKTFLRSRNISGKCTIVVGKDQYFHALNQLEDLKADPTTYQFIVEPCAKNTYPAIVAAALNSNYKQLLITPCDHHIEPEEDYRQKVLEATQVISDAPILCFGIKPKFAHTGYGYIQANGSEILKFTEKPNQKLAQEFLSSGDFFWNSGMFLINKDSFLAQTQEISNLLFSKVNQSWKDGAKEGETLYLNLNHYEEISSESIDYGFLEKTENAKFLGCSYNWNDLGNYKALSEFVKNKNVLNTDSKENFFYTKKELVTFGIDDLIVVEDEQSILVGRLSECENVKNSFQAIENLNEKKVFSKLKENRPWGDFESIDDSEQSGFKVKKINVLPGRSLSLQKHKFRAEHWIVVKGRPVVTVGESVKEYEQGSHIYIAVGEVHRLENHTDEIATIVEVQLGSYLGEDDIIRLEDKYKRT
jgi:mannose-1-phosphate guanylyltransferase